MRDFADKSNYHGDRPMQCFVYAAAAAFAIALGAVAADWMTGEQVVTGLISGAINCEVAK